MAKHRDYRAEYQRRKEIAEQRGLTTAQARGHARIHQGEAKISTLRAHGLVSAPVHTTQSLVTADGAYFLVDLDKRNTSKLAKWANAQERILDKRTSRLSKREAERELRSFRNKTVKDVQGHVYTLSVDMNTIQRAISEGSDTGTYIFEKRYRVPGSEVAA